MRKVFAVLVVSVFFHPVFAGDDSPLSVIERLQSMPDQLVDYAKDLIDRGIEPTNEMLRDKIFAMFEGVLSGQALAAAKENVRAGLAKGWPLADTDDFCWAFPMTPDLFGESKVVSKNDSAATIEFRGGIMQTYVSFEEVPSYELRLVSWQDDEAARWRDSDDGSVLQAKANYLATIKLKASSAGWRITDFQEFISERVAVSEG